MPKCELYIDRPVGHRLYAPGDTVDAVVRVETSDPVQCRGLELELGWRTHGKGNRDGTVCRSETLFEGNWGPGEFAEYTAELTLPRLSSRTPATYAGKYVNVDWYLRVTADIPWAFDPDAEVTIVVAEEVDPAPYEPPKVITVEPVELTGGLVGGLIPAIVLILIGLFGLTKVAWLGALIVVPSVMLLIASWRQRELREEFGHVEFGTWPQTTTPGSELHAFLALTPAADVEVEHISVEVVATERATSGSGTNTTEYSDRCFRATETIAGSARLRAGETLRLEGEFVIPPDAPMTFQASDNSVQWEIVVSIKPRGRRAFEHRRPLVVGGAGQRTSSGASSGASSDASSGSPPM